MAATTIMADEEKPFQKLRALSLPDMTELSDIIVALDDVLDDVERDDVSLASPQNHPVRLFSLGLHRSMSMPKQQGKVLEEKKEESDDFYFPDDEDGPSTVQEGFLPTFYSEETLSTVIPPTGAKKMASPSSPRVNGSTGNESYEETKLAQSDSNEKVAPAAEKESLTASFRDVALKRSAQREAALSNLSAFFGSDKEADTSTSPTSVSMFPETKSVLKMRSKSLPSCSEATASSEHNNAAKPPSPPRRSIFGKVYTDGPSSSSSDFDFKMLQESDRTTSMPANLPSSRVPRKPSLKKVSSFVGNSKSESSGSLKPSVSFSNLEIREYDVTLGDNPSCSFGPPVSLGWDFRDAQVVPLEKYERAREKKCPRRNPRQLVLSYNVRKYLLLKTAGYTKAELREAMKEVERIKNQRKMTDMMLPLDEVMEGVIDHVKSMFQKK